MIIRFLRPLTLAVFVTCAAFSYSASAQTATPDVVRTAFAVKIAGTQAPGTTLWVAYGPLAGKFGIVEMHRAAGGLYRLSLNLPRGARGQFYYIAGHGSMSTRQGIVPGNPVATIGHTGMAVIGQSHIPVLLWHPPLG